MVIFIRAAALKSNLSTNVEFTFIVKIWLISMIRALRTKKNQNLDFDDDGDDDNGEIIM